MNTKEKLIVVLETHPAKIEAQVKQVLDLQNAIKQLKDVMNNREFAIKGEVAEDAKKEDWKKTLSNETLRKTEVQSRLGRDEKYIRSQDELLKLDEGSIDYIKAETSRMRREFESALVLLPLLAGGKQ